MRGFFLTSFLCLTLPAWGQRPELAVPVGHTGKVSCVAFCSIDGKAYILTGSEDNTAKLWDMNGKELQTFKGHNGAITSVAFSSKNKQVLTGSEDGTAKLWELDGKLDTTIVPEGAIEQTDYSTSGINYMYSMNGIAFSPGGNSFLAGNGMGSVNLWGLNGEKLGAFRQGGQPDQEGSVTSDPSNTGQFFMLPQGPPITSVAFSPDGKRILAGTFKGVLFWNLNGDEAQGPSICENAGRILSIAYSPKGNAYVASCKNTVVLVDGDKKINLPIPAVLNTKALAFSPDGNYFLTGNKDSLTVWNLKGQLIHTLCGSAKTPYRAAFAPDSKAVLAICDGTARLWSLDGRELLALRGHSRPVNAALLSPDAEHLLIKTGDGSATMWNLAERGNKPFCRDGLCKCQAFTFSPDNQAILSTCGDSVKFWSLNGEEIKAWKASYADAIAFANGGNNILTIEGKDAQLWDLNGNEIETFTTDNIDISELDFSAEGKFALWEGDEKVKLWDFDGQLIRSFRTDEWEALTEEGYSLRFLFSPDWKFMLDESSMVLKPFRPPGAARDTIEDGAYIYTFSPDSKKLLTVAETSRAHVRSLDGEAEKAFDTHDCFAGSAMFFPNNKFIITTGKEDHSTKLWDASTGEELATLVSIDSTDWVVTTPLGLFDASPGAMQLMHYVVGLEVIELEQLKERYYEPGLLQKLLGFSDEPLRSVDGFDTVALYPAVSLQLDTEANQLQIKLTARNGGLGQVSVFVNGKEIIEDLNPPQGFERKRNTSLGVNLARYSRYFLQDSLNIVSVRAYNEAGWLKSPAHTITYRPRFSRSKGTENGASPSPSFSFVPSPNPAFYAIIVGTANYAGDKLDLKYPGKDAEAMTSALRQAAGQLFGADSVFVSLLTTDTTDEKMLPTKANIKAAFDDFEKRAKAEDILLVYLSGHGVTYGDAERAQFYYLTQDIRSEGLSDEGVRNTRAISSRELTKWINAIPAQKQVLILDACNSGRVVEALKSGSKSLNSTQIRALDRMQGRTGMFVLAGSAADKVSYEASQYGQGLLTYSLLEAMSVREGKLIDVVQLFDYARDQVPKLSEAIGGIQTPTMLTPTGGSIYIGIVNEHVKIPYTPKKPVFVRNIFMEETELNDKLGIGKSMEAQMEEITARGAGASLVYWDVPEYQNAYSIKGLYRLNGEDISLRAKLFKGKEPLGDIQAKGEAGALNTLVERILQQAFRILEK